MFQPGAMFQRFRQRVHSRQRATLIPNTLLPLIYGDLGKAVVADLRTHHTASIIRVKVVPLIIRVPIADVLVNVQVRGFHHVCNFSVIVVI